MTRTLALGAVSRVISLLIVAVISRSFDVISRLLPTNCLCFLRRPTPTGRRTGIRTRATPGPPFLSTAFDPRIPIAFLGFFPMQCVKLTASCLNRSRSCEDNAIIHCPTHTEAGPCFALNHQPNELVCGYCSHCSTLNAHTRTWPHSLLTLT